MQDILIFGAGGHAKTVINIVEQAGIYRVAGIIDDRCAVGQMVYGYQVLGGMASLPDTGIKHGIVSIGDGWVRGTVAAKISALLPDFAFVTAIHPMTALARGVTLGAGSVIMAGSVVNSDTSIGDHTVLYLQTSVGHDCRIGNFVNIHPNVGIGGSVCLDDYASIGMGANVIHGLTVGEHTVIGAGSTVVKSIEARVLAYGSPCKAVRERNPGEVYL